ncbi:hypothetical protein CDAR_564131 [Caerostris darwini]|uniref:Uncharacterized protein n=1 Tax=Caerostris darwini TaxID=1538125 RepID=A0AAV4M590_9ARAC|nr:hypothetical protein CDAR_564131 [Caerostris darwini]
MPTDIFKMCSALFKILCSILKILQNSSGVLEIPVLRSDCPRRYAPRCKPPCYTTISECFYVIFIMKGDSMRVPLANDGLDPSRPRRSTHLTRADLFFNRKKTSKLASKKQPSSKKSPRCCCLKLPRIESDAVKFDPVLQH